MKGLAHIVILHPAAIGDATLATPVSRALKQNFPQAKITYWSHESLRPLLSMCPSVDDFIAYERGRNLLSLARTLKGLKPDLLVNLSNAAKFAVIPLLAGVKTVHYKKTPDGIEPMQHAVDNFMNTIHEIVSTVPTEHFPTLFPSEEQRHQLFQKWHDRLPGDRSRGESAMIALVPGVGKIRPNRSWPIERWAKLARRLLERERLNLVLIGGKDEVEISGEINRLCEDRLFNLSGQLDLSQTATLLSCCRLTVSGDTGPAHISVAVGTPVLGLYGPTAPQRSGPFGCENLIIDRYGACKCQYSKRCRLLPKEIKPEFASGLCMQEIEVDQVLAMIDRALNWSTPAGII